MDELRAYLKSLPDEPAREAFAVGCGTTLGHLRNCIYESKRQLAAASCVLVEQLSAGKVMRWHLRADWREIWPELKRRKGAPSTADSEAA